MYTVEYYCGVLKAVGMGFALWGRNCIVSESRLRVSFGETRVRANGLCLHERARVRVCPTL